LTFGCLVYVRAATLWPALVPLAAAGALWAGRTQYCRGANYLAAEKLFCAIEKELPYIAVVLNKTVGGPTLP
jgi:hypothetical protein